MVPARPAAEDPGVDPWAELARRAPTSAAAAEEFVRVTHPDVARLCRILTDAQAAPDVVQETYLRVLAALPGFRGEASVRVWLLAIARRTAADHVRREQRRRRLDVALRRQPHTEAVAPSTAVEHDDLLAALPRDYRAAFVATQVLGLDYAGAAQVLGCPVGTVRSRVHRARQLLIGSLAED